MNVFKLRVGILFLGLILTACSKEENPPNVIIILTDDQGWGDIASHGNPDIDTPHLDNFATSGARFDRFFVSPVCAPTRASLLTGRDHLRTGTQWVTYGLENMNAEEVTFGEVFKEAGYETGLFGKWHNGSHYPMDPNGQGFDTFFGFKQGHWNNYFDTELEYNGNPVQTKGFITDVLTDSALAFIEKNQNVPFLTFIPYNAPHSPFQVPDQYFDKYKAQGLDDKNASVYGMVENIDDNVGRIINRLDELNISENTIVIFLTDNGPNGGDRYNGNMKGWKAKVDEGGVRVPLFIKWPAKIKPGTEIKELTAHIDFLPSLVELAGITSPETKPLDGRSFAPLLFSDEFEWNDRFFFTHQSRWDSLEMYPASVRNNQYRAVRYGENWELYDMNEDQGQRTDISDMEPELTAQFAEEYDKWFAEVTKNLPESRPIPVGYEASPITSLPAVESSFTGEIRFHGTSGWSNDWLDNWVNTTDQVWWNLEVLEAGNYEVILEYTLAKGNEGVQITASSSSEMITTTINDVFDPEFIPSPDRVERGEVNEKQWAKKEIGSIYLQNGNQTLTIQNSKIYGNKGIELKKVILKKTD
ncbi:MAG: arylsulfatase [Balneolaceae bacterium]